MNTYHTVTFTFSASKEGMPAFNKLTVATDNILEAIIGVSQKISVDFPNEEFKIWGVTRKEVLTHES